MERLEALARPSGFDISGFVQSAALEAAYLKSPSRKGQRAMVNVDWLIEAFQTGPENITTVKEQDEAQVETPLKTARITKAAAANDGSAAAQKTTPKSASTLWHQP